MTEIYIRAHSKYFTSDKGGGMFLPELVWLSVCVQDYSKSCAWIWMKCWASTDVGDMDDWLTFEPDPDYSPDAGNGLLSPILYALQCKIILHRENPTYRYWAAATRSFKMVLRPTTAAMRGFTRFYSPRAVGTLLEVHALYRGRVPF